MLKLKTMENKSLLDKSYAKIKNQKLNPTLRLKISSVYKKGSIQFMFLMAFVYWYIRLKKKTLIIKDIVITNVEHLDIAKKY